MNAHRRTAAALLRPAAVGAAATDISGQSQIGEMSKWAIGGVPMWRGVPEKCHFFHHLGNVISVSMTGTRSEASHHEPAYFVAYDASELGSLERRRYRMSAASAALRSRVAWLLDMTSATAPHLHQPPLSGVYSPSRWV